jgi:S-adenosylmethionine decarboxylase
LTLTALRPSPGSDAYLAPIRLYTLDAWVEDEAALVDHGGLRTLLYAAATGGGAHVLADTFHVFPNGAVTGALLLAQSHLSIHTWPERLMANVDLLSCGPVDGERVMGIVRDGLGAARATICCVTRGVDA